MKCEAKDCDQDADFIVMWPNQVTRQCRYHTERVIGVGNIMGISVPVIPILDIEDDQEKK